MSSRATSQPGGDDDGVGGDLVAVGEDDAGDALAVDAQRRRWRGRAPAPRGGRARVRAAQRRHQLARVDRVVGVDLQRQADRRRERGLEPARLRRAQPLDRQAEAAAELGEAIERLGLVAVAGDDQRADRAVAGVVELAHEGLRSACALSRPSCSSSRSPNSASETGASMPAATCHAPGSPASSTTVFAPRCAARQAQARPIAPPPTTATS